MASFEDMRMPSARLTTSSVSHFAMSVGNSTFDGSVGRAPTGGGRGVVVGTGGGGRGLFFDGSVGRAPIGGRRMLMFGTGTGSATFFVTGSKTLRTMIFFASPSRLKLKDSTFVCASMLTFKAGCGMGMRMSGPQ